MDNKKTQSELSDERIVEMLFERQERGLYELDRKYRNYLISIAYNILGDRLDSEECLNDTYNATWNSIPPARPASLKAYVAKVIRGKAINRYNEATSQKRVPRGLCEPLGELEGIIGYVDGVEYDEMARDIGMIVSAYLEGLPDRALYIFVARYFYARRLETIAERLDVSLSTVNKELSTMKKELRQKLKDGGYTV